MGTIDVCPLVLVLFMFPCESGEGTRENLLPYDRKNPSLIDKRLSEVARGGSHTDDLLAYPLMRTINAP